MAKLIVSPASMAGVRVGKTPTTPLGRMLLAVDMLKPFAQTGAEAQARAWSRVREAVWGARENKFDVRKRFFAMVDRCPSDARVFGRKGEAKFQLLAKLADEVKRYERDCPRVQETQSVVVTRATRVSTREQNAKRQREHEEVAEPDRARQKTSSYYVATKGRATVHPASDESFVDLIAELKPHLESDGKRSADLWACIGERLVGKSWPRSLKTQSLKLRFQYLERVLQDAEHSEHKRHGRSLRAKLAEYCEQLARHREAASEPKAKDYVASPVAATTKKETQQEHSAMTAANTKEKDREASSVATKNATEKDQEEPSVGDDPRPKEKASTPVLPRTAAERRKHSAAHAHDFRGRMDQFIAQPKHGEGRKDAEETKSTSKLALHESFVVVLSHMDRNLHKEATHRMRLLELVVQNAQKALEAQ